MLWPPVFAIDKIRSVKFNFLFSLFSVPSQYFVQFFSSTFCQLSHTNESQKATFFLILFVLTVSVFTFHQSIIWFWYEWVYYVLCARFHTHNLHKLTKKAYLERYLNQIWNFFLFSFHFSIALLHHKCFLRDWIELWQLYLCLCQFLRHHLYLYASNSYIPFSCCVHNVLVITFTFFVLVCD